MPALPKIRAPLRGGLGRIARIIRGVSVVMTMGKMPPPFTGKLQSAIDAVLAQLAALTTGGGSNLINAQAWSGEISWDLLLGTNTLRNLHFNALSLQNEGFTLSLACDSYSIALVALMGLQQVLPDVFLGVLLGVRRRGERAITKDPLVSAKGSATLEVCAASAPSCI